MSAADILAAEVTKLRTLPAAWIGPAVAAAGNALLARAEAPSGILLAPAYAFAALGAYAGGGDRSGAELLAVPRRHRLFAAKLVTTAAAVALAAVPAVVPGFLAEPGPRRAADLAARLGVYALFGLLAFGLAVLARGVAVPLAVLVVAPLVVSPPLRAAFPAVARRLPHEAALSLLHLGPDLSGPAALLTLTAWAAAAVLAAGWAFSRR